MPEISEEDLYLLVCCAVDYNTRLPYGSVPPDIWKLLTPKQQQDLTEHMRELYVINTENRHSSNDPA